MKTIGNLKQIRAMWFGIGAFLLASCTTMPKSVDTIPDDTYIVAVFDVFSIARKGKLAQIPNMEFFKAIHKEMESENKKLSQFIDDFIENPMMPGINFRKDVFAYYVDQAKDEQFVCISAEMGNEAKFADFLENVLHEMDINYIPENQGNYNYTIVENELGVAWDADKAVFLVPFNSQSKENLEPGIGVLMNLEENGRITAIGAFNEFMVSKKDISTWFSSNVFEHRRIFQEIEDGIGYDLSNIYLSTYLDFGNNDITLSTQLNPNSDVEELFGNKPIIGNDFNMELLEIFPSKYLCAASMCFDPLSYLNVMEKQGSYEDLKNGFEEKTGFDLEEIVENFGGSVICSLFDFGKVEYSYMGYDEVYNPKKYRNYNPQTGKYYFQGGYDNKYVEKTKEELLPLMGLAFDFKDDQIIMDLVEIIPKQFLTPKNGYYEFMASEKFPAYFALNETACLLTNHEKTIMDFNDGNIGKDNLSLSEIKDGIAMNPMFAVAKLNSEDYPQEFIDEITEDWGNKRAELLKVWDEIAKSAEFKQIDAFSHEFVFRIQECPNNSLNKIITVLDHNYGLLVNM